MAKPHDRYLAAALSLLLMAFMGLVLMRTGLYAWTLFLFVPSFIGGAAVWMKAPATRRGAAGIGALAATAAAFSLLLLGKEGLICVLMCVPLTVPLGALGGLIAHSIRSSRRRAGSAAMLLLVPFATLGWDLSARPKLYQVQSEITIAASPEQVWKQVVAFSEIGEPHEWYFRTGLAYPVRAHLEGTGPGAVRYCEFSTGPFVEPIEVWDEPRLLQFRVTQNPSPMREWSFYGEIEPKHLHGYLVSKRGEFRLIPLASGQTLLRGTTWYQHGLWPSEYWRWWSDAIIHRIHLRVLSHIRDEAEGR